MIGKWSNVNSTAQAKGKVYIEPDASQPNFSTEFSFVLPSGLARWAGLPSRITMEFILRVDPENKYRGDVYAYNVLTSTLDVGDVLVNAIVHSGAVEYFDDERYVRYTLAAYGLLKSTVGSIVTSTRVAVHVQDEHPTGYNMRISTIVEVFTGRVGPPALDSPSRSGSGSPGRMELTQGVIGEPNQEVTDDTFLASSGWVSVSPARLTSGDP